MVEDIITKIRQLFDGDPSVRKVADDPILSAELLLLFRMILADGVVRESELEMFKHICKEAFDIDEEGFQSVVRYLHDFSYETTGIQAMDVFKHLSPNRKKLLIEHMLSVAKADNMLHEQERKLLRRTLDFLGYSDSKES